MTYFEKYVHTKLQTKYERFSLKNKKHLPITVPITVLKTLTGAYFFSHKPNPLKISQELEQKYPNEKPGGDNTNPIISLSFFVFFKPENFGIRNF